jgi:hypothetical protein
MSFDNEKEHVKFWLLFFKNNNAIVFVNIKMKVCMYVCMCMSGGLPLDLHNISPWNLAWSPHFTRARNQARGQPKMLTPRLSPAHPLLLIGSLDQSARDYFTIVLYLDRVTIVLGPTHTITPKFGMDSSFHPGSAPSQGVTQNVGPRPRPLLILSSLDLSARDYFTIALWNSPG